METDDYPAAEAPTATLIGHIVSRYHETHRREFPELIALARTVEASHASDPNTPHGLTQALEAMAAGLEKHMRREEAVLFPAFEAGSSEHAAGFISCQRGEHAGQEAEMDRIAAITHGFRLPAYACRTWRLLYEGLGKMIEDLDEHMHLENDVLFPRFEARG